jgi:choice-of-anchor B domain-containing protein
MYIKIILLLVLLISNLYSQSNIELLSNLDDYHSARYNDIWGYVDPSGNEYALLGVRTGTSIISLADPTNPFEIAFIPATNSIWRDIKVHDQYAYVVSDGTSDGLQIIDLSQLPNTATLAVQLNTWFNAAHNIFIDNGYAYVIGTNNFSGGMHILDLSDPTSPTRTATYTASGYIHDVYVWDDTVVVCAGSSGEYHLVDVTDKTNPQLISTSIPIPGIYAHSGWMTEDKRYFYATEEFNQVDITVWDLQDRSSWDLVVPSWETNSGATVHNLFFVGNYAHISYYSDGYVILDISDPLNPVLVGQYTTPDMWGCYPYFPSGITICSDIINGLYVFNSDFGLPVELSSFTATTSDGSVTLNWTTETEKNNLGFEVERKIGGVFTTIGFVAGHGTSTKSQQYSFTDTDLSNDVHHYRLKQIDFDGTLEYSKIIEVEVLLPSVFKIEQNYPNPFNPSTNITFSIPESGVVILRVFNIIGEQITELINEYLESGNYTVNFSAANLSTGIYLARLSSGDNIQMIKMSLLK